jgi:integrase
MPSAERYRDNSRGVWRYRGRYRDAAGVRHSRTFDTKAAALRWAGEEEAKVHRGQRSDPSGAKMRWGDWCDRWLDAKQSEPRTRRTDESIIRKHVRPRWGTTPLLAISRIDVQGWVNQMTRKGSSASTCRKALYALSSSLSAAVDEGILTANPCAGAKAPTNPSGQERYLSDVAAGQILYHLDGRWRVLAELILGTGLRLSEACGLHAARVDLATGRLDVVETYDPAVNGGEMRGFTKNKKGRSVPLSPELAGLLQEWLDRNPPAKTCGRKHRGGRCPSGLLITGEQGGPIDGHNFTQRQWRDACDRAGIPGIRAHDLRHTYASRLVQLGVPLERVQLLLGHRDLKTTQRYASLRPQDGWDDVRAALSSSITAARAEATEKRLRALP